MRRAGPALVLIAASLLAACEAGREGPNLVLITVDTLRADHLTPYGYERPTSPFLEELAAESVLFEDAIAQCGTTQQSLSSLMTGLYPYSDFILTKNESFFYLKRSNETLAEILTRAGYRTHAVGASVQVTPITGLDLGLETFDHIDLTGYPLKHNRRIADQVTERALAWLAAEGSGERPFFLWLHYLDPHHPYSPPESHASWLAELEEGIEEGETRTYRFDEMKSSSHPLSDGEIERIGLGYDREIRYLDDSLRRLFEEGLAELADRTLVVFTADHGESLGEHGIITHNDVYQSIIRVPLMIRRPAEPRPGSRVATPVMLIDLFPTLLSLLDLPFDGEHRGQSLVPLLDGAEGAFDADRYLFSEYPGHQSFQHGDFKLIDWGDRRELYDLRADPDETEDLFPARREAAGRLLRIANEHRRRTFHRQQELERAGAPEELPPPQVTPSMLEELEALGYGGQ